VNWYTTLPTGVVASRRSDHIIVRHLDTVPAVCSPNYEVPLRTDNMGVQPFCAKGAHPLLWAGSLSARG